MDKLLKGAVAGVGGFVGYFYGGWTPMLQLLLIVAAFDYASGMTASAFEGKTNKGAGLSSKTGFKGIAKKVFMFGMVAISHKVDAALGSGHVFRDATIAFYLANEMLSITENAGRIGLPVPEQIKQVIAIFKGKSEKK